MKYAFNCFQWYARYSRWEQATKWLAAAESHRPKLSTFLSASAELKMLECQLIFVNHYLDCKRYQHFAKVSKPSVYKYFSACVDVY